nr:uncharacterized protein LOC101264141 [Solanum lycopersicum]
MAPSISPASTRSSTLFGPVCIAIHAEKSKMPYWVLQLDSNGFYDADLVHLKEVSGMESEIQFVKCACCGLTEECTESYIARVRDRNEGRWICGLCAEAVKDEMVRSRRIGRDEALNRHMTFCKKFRAKSLPPNPTGELISAVKQLLLKTLDSPTSNTVSRRALVRSQSCFE